MFLDTMLPISFCFSGPRRLGEKAQALESSQLHAQPLDGLMQRYKDAVISAGFPCLLLLAGSNQCRLGLSSQLT